MDPLLVRLVAAVQLVRECEHGTDEEWTDAHELLYGVLDEIDAARLERPADEIFDSGLVPARRRRPQFGFPDVRPGASSAQR